MEVMQDISNVALIQLTLHSLIVLLLRCASLPRHRFDGVEVEEVPTLIYTPKQPQYGLTQSFESSEFIVLLLLHVFKDLRREDG